MSATKKPDVISSTSRPSLLSLFDEFEAQQFDQVEVGLPPLAGQSATGPVAVSSVDLSGMARVWMLIGRGGSGKTLLARWLGSMIAERDLLGSTILAALDPTNRTLARFFNGVRQPQTAETDEAAAFLRRLVKFVAAKPMHGVWDFGGGDLSASKLIAVDPQFDRGMAAKGTAVVAAYLLTPSIDDLSILSAFEASGFQPEATALILNLGKAPNVAAFAALRAQNAYKQAIARGAVEILMPDLEPVELSLEIERRRLHFFQAAAGQTPIDGLDAAMLRFWLDRMNAAFAPIQNWLPWN